MDLKDQINETLGRVDKLKEEQKKVKEMLSDIFVNDPTYQLHDTAVKDAQKTRNGTKKQIMKQPQATVLAAKIIDFKSQIKELNETLSGYLQNYQESSGLFQFEDENGEMREIVYTARLVKRN